MRAVGEEKPSLESCDAIHGRTLALIDRLEARNRPSPYVTLSYAQSLDGCISAAAGVGTNISNASSRVVSHRLRAVHDAILVGINTVLVDDPRLTVRLVEGADPRPVIVDTRLRMPLHARLLKRNSRAPIVATLESSSLEKEHLLQDSGVEVVRLPANADGAVDLRCLFSRLVERGIRAVMIEGGARIISSVLSERLADQLVLTISPMILGGVRAVECFNGGGGSAPPLRKTSWHWADGNLLLQGELERMD